MTRVNFVINGSRTVHREAGEVIRFFSEHPEMDAASDYTNKQGHARELALKWCKQGTDVIIAGGGDGTLNEVVNGIMQFEGEKPLLGILPNGTGNDFFKGAVLTVDPEVLLNFVTTGKYRAVDVVRLKSDIGERYFINIADVGFGARVVEVLTEQRRIFGKGASYMIAILRAFASYKKPNLRITTETETVTGETLMVAICNGGIFGNGLTINPYADMRDGWLDVTVLGKVSLFDYLRNLNNLKKGKKIVHREARYLRAKRVEIEVLGGNAVAELDGEYYPEGNVVMDILPEALKIVG